MGKAWLIFKVTSLAERGGCRPWRGGKFTISQVLTFTLLFLPFLFFSLPIFPFWFPHPITSHSGGCVARGWRAPAESCSARWVAHASRPPVGRAVLVLPGCPGPSAGSLGRRPPELLTPAAQLPLVYMGAHACLYRSPLSSAVHALRAGLARVARPLPQSLRPPRSHGAREPPARPSEGTRTAIASATARAVAGTAATAR